MIVNYNGSMKFVIGDMSS